VWTFLPEVGKKAIFKIFSQKIFFSQYVLFGHKIVENCPKHDIFHKTSFLSFFIYTAPLEEYFTSFFIKFPSKMHTENLL